MRVIACIRFFNYMVWVDHSVFNVGNTDIGYLCAGLCYSALATLLKVEREGKASVYLSVCLSPCSVLSRVGYTASPGYLMLATLQ